jgi:hypothetical protein
VTERSKSDKAAEYRKSARECLDVAERMSLGADRQRMMSMAQRWLQLAEKAEAGEGAD